MPAVPAPGPGKTAGEDAAVEVAAELPLHIFRHRPVVVVTVAASGEPGLEVLVDAATGCDAFDVDGFDVPLTAPNACSSRWAIDGRRARHYLARDVLPNSKLIH